MPSWIQFRLNAKRIESFSIGRDNPPNTGQSQCKEDWKDEKERKLNMKLRRECLNAKRIESGFLKRKLKILGVSLNAKRIESYKLIMRLRSFLSKSQCKEDWKKLLSELQTPQQAVSMQRGLKVCELNSKGYKLFSLNAKRIESSGRDI